MKFYNSLKVALFALACIMLGISCDGSLSTVVDVDLPEADKKMAIHLDLSTRANDTSYFTVVKVLPENVEDREGELDIHLVDLKITNNTNGQALTIGAKEIYSNYLINYAFSANEINSGDEIEMVLNYPELETAECKVVVPEKAPMIKNLLVEPEVKDAFSGDRYYPVSFSFNDPEGEDFYSVNFQFSAKTIDLSSDGDTVSIFSSFTEGYTDGYSEDPVINDAQNGFIIADKTFEGSNKELQFRLYSREGFGSYYGGVTDTTVYKYEGKVFFNKISKARYDFERSYANFQDNDGNPFGTPVSVYNNIENGYGIFSVSNGIVYEFSF